MNESAKIPLTQRLASTTVPLVIGGVLIALLTWFGQNAVTNHDSPRRITAVEQDINSMKQNVSDVRADIAAMKVSLQHIERQNERIIARLDKITHEQ